MFNIQNWFDDINDGNIVIAYKGEITSELISDYLELVESKLDGKNVNPKIRRKVYNVLVECLQNLYHHLDIIAINGDSNIKGKYAAFAVEETESGFKISTGNFVKKSKIGILEEKLERVNTLSKDDLKALYKKVLNNHEFSEKGGGGLGMIDIAKRTGSKLDYRFYDFNNEYSFYSLNINVFN